MLSAERRIISPGINPLSLIKVKTFVTKSLSLAPAEKGFFELVEGDAVEGEVFRALADAGDAALVAGHVLGCELGESVLLAGIFDHVVLAYG